MMAATYSINHRLQITLRNSDQPNTRQMLDERATRTLEIYSEIYKRKSVNSGMVFRRSMQLQDLVYAVQLVRDQYGRADAFRRYMMIRWDFSSQRLRNVLICVDVYDVSTLPGVDLGLLS
jgi:hypothetical protein